MGEWRSWKKTKKKKKAFNYSRYSDLEGSHNVNKCANKLKVHEKTVRTAIKQDLRPDLNSFDYAIWGILENKTNATFHPNIASLKTAIEDK